ncbi:MAG: hypothetical protein ACP5QN_01310 [Minisyncoccia bacterium]
MNWLKKHIFLNIFFAISLILLISGFVPLFLKFKMNDVIILKYSNFSGITLIGNFYDLILIFITSIIVFGGNFILAKNFEERDIFLGKLIAVLNFFVCLLIFIYFITIIKVN